jgi:hypothetical protein
MDTTQNKADHTLPEHGHPTPLPFPQVSYVSQHNLTLSLAGVESPASQEVPQISYRVVKCLIIIRTSEPN